MLVQPLPVLERIFQEDACELSDPTPIYLRRVDELVIKLLRHADSYVCVHTIIPFPWSRQTALLSSVLVLQAH
jgi:hypothetical protein